MKQGRSGWGAGIWLFGGSLVWASQRLRGDEPFCERVGISSQPQRPVVQFDLFRPVPGRCIGAGETSL